MADKRLVTFQDTIGQELAWARAAPYQFTVVWRRWHEGEWRSWGSRVSSSPRGFLVGMRTAPWGSVNARKPRWGTSTKTTWES